MVVVQKRDGTPRRTVDLQSLNRECLRETHHTQAPFHLVNQIPPNTYKTLFNAKDRYQAVELDEESHHLTTFITEWGRYRYARGPQGFIGTGAFYSHHTNDISEIRRQHPTLRKVCGRCFLEHIPLSPSLLFIGHGI